MYHAKSCVWRLKFLTACEAFSALNAGLIFPRTLEHVGALFLTLTPVSKATATLDSSRWLISQAYPNKKCVLWTIMMT